MYSHPAGDAVRIGGYMYSPTTGDAVEVLMPPQDFILFPFHLTFEAQASGSDHAKTIEGKPVSKRRIPCVVSGVPSWLYVDLVVISDKIATISGGKPPFTLSSVPDWIGAGVDGQIITVYPTSENTSTVSDRTADITVTDQQGNTVTLTVTQRAKNIFIMVGEGNIPYTDDGGITWV
jgi:hypothetical protein